MNNKPEIIRDKQGKFTKGHSGNHKGKPKGILNHNGLTACLDALKEVASKEENIKLLKESFNASMKENPEKFYLTFIMPLLPKNIDIGLRKDTLTDLFNIMENGINSETKR